MKQVKLQDLKPSTLYWRKEGNDLEPIETWTWASSTLGKYLAYSRLGSEEESHATPEDVYYELAVPSLQSIDLFEKSYDGESIVDLSRDISECLDSDFNPIVNEIPEMEDSPGFWAGKFVVTVQWVPDGE
jgi:hypothetical protein